jgi:hypothetical protein
MSENLGSLNVLEHSGPKKACSGRDLLSIKVKKFLL